MEPTSASVEEAPLAEGMCQLQVRALNEGSPSIMGAGPPPQNWEASVEPTRARVEEAPLEQTVETVSK